MVSFTSIYCRRTRNFNLMRTYMKMGEGRRRRKKKRAREKMSISRKLPNKTGYNYTVRDGVDEEIAYQLFFKY